MDKEKRRDMEERYDGGETWRRSCEEKHGEEHRHG